MSQDRPIQSEPIDVAATPAPQLGSGWGGIRSKAHVWVSAHGLEALALLWIVAFAFTLRTVNVNWDRNQHLHPDERFLAIVSDEISLPSGPGEYFDSANSPLNPYNRDEGATFVYGTFPLFLNKAVSEWLDVDAKAAGASPECAARQRPERQDADGNWSGDPECTTHRTADWLFGALETFGISVERADGSRIFDDGYNSNLVGRVLSAIFDTFTLLLVFELGRFLYTRRVGLLAAALFSVTVLHLQYSHFFGSETFVAFFATAVVYFSARIWKRGDWWDYAGAGAATGLALACKLSVAPVVLVVALAVVMRAWPALVALWHRTLNALDAKAPRTGESVPWREIALPAAGGIASLLVAGLVFRVFQPYAFEGPGFFDIFRLDLSRHDVLSLSGWLNLEPFKPTNYLALDERFVRDIDALRELQTGTDFPPNLQWIGRTPFVFPATNMITWGLGVFLSCAVAAGMARGAWRLARNRDLAALLPLFWVVFLFLFIARGFVPTMRYFLPIYPTMAILGSAGVAFLWDWASGKPAFRLPARLPQRERLARHAPRGAQILAGVLVAGTFLWGIAFITGVYGRDISRVQASIWIGENVPAGAKLSNQAWDDGLPLSLPESHLGDYVPVQLSPYDLDSREKVLTLVEGLDQIDYVIESSNRLYDSIPRIPAKYPSTVRYYEALFDGSLGFEKVAEFTNYPGLPGIEFPDQSAEEAFSVYDHPRVIIWKKTDAYSRERALYILQPDRAATAIGVAPGDAATNALQLRPEDYRTQQSGGSWSDVFDPDGWASSAPWLWWLLWLEVAAFAALPWTSWLLRALPDRGYGLSKLLGFAAVALPAWLLVAWKAVHFSGALVWVLFAVAVAAGAALAWQRRSTLAAEFRERWPIFAVSEALFLAAFFGFLALRAWNPDIWYHPTGGEKPMEMAYLTAVTRSTTLPPYDPWFAGGYMNYYYMGWFFLAVPIRALQIVPEVAFNLGIPTYAALAAATACSTVYNLVALSIRALPGRDVARASLRPAIITGLVAAFLLVLAGNLDGLHQTVERVQAVNTWGAFSGTPVLGGAVGIAGGLKAMVFDGAELPAYDWWRSSRVHFDNLNDIVEFPYWSFLFADLHPHVMGLPFFGASVGLAVAYVASARAGLRLQAWVLAIALGLVVGLIRTVNTWDFPTVALIGVASVTIGQLLRTGPARNRALEGFAQLAAAAAVLFVIYTPYTANSEVFNTGLIRSRETTAPQQFFSQFGIFVLITVAYLAMRYIEARREAPSNVIAGLFDGWFAIAGLTTFVVGLAVFTFSSGLTVVALSSVVLLLLLNLLWVDMTRPERDTGRILGTAALVLAVGIAAGVDVVTVTDDIARQNTVFKFSMQAWQLWALGSAYATWYVGSALWRAEGWRARPRAGRSGLAVAAAAGGLALLAAALIFPVSGTRARQDARFATDVGPTLDGLAYLSANPIYHEDGGTADPSDDVDLNLSDDEPLIRWMRENVEGSPTIVEAVGGLYHWTNRISVNTGLPAVIGWDWHQIQQRGQFAGPIGVRRADTMEFYRTPDPGVAATYLRKYDVSYVVVGATERALGTPDGIAKFGAMAALNEVFRDGDSALYRVDKEALGSGAS